MHKPERVASGEDYLAGALLALTRKLDDLIVSSRHIANSTARIAVALEGYLDDAAEDAHFGEASKTPVDATIHLSTTQRMVRSPHRSMAAVRDDTTRKHPLEPR